MVDTVFECCVCVRYSGRRPQDGEDSSPARPVFTRLDPQELLQIQRTQSTRQISTFVTCCCPRQKGSHRRRRPEIRLRQKGKRLHD
jgi:hypothetical protein